VNPAASLFSRRVLLFQAALCIVGFVMLALFSPRLLRLDPDIVPETMKVGAALSALSLFTCTVLAALRLRTERFTLRTLALGSLAIEPEDLAGIARLPGALTKRFIATCSVFALVFLIPGVRPDKIDDGRAISLLIMAITLLWASAVPHYVVIRSAASRLLEIAPIEPVTLLLEEEEKRAAKHMRGTRRLLFATVVPALLIGVGVVLITHAHLRSFIEEGRKSTAVAIARTSLEPGPSPIGRSVGRDGAIASARASGYEVTWRPQPVTETRFYREADGRLTTVVPLEDGSAKILFSAQLDPRIITGGVAIALAFAAIAAWLAYTLGRTLAQDFERTTERVRMLGTETVMQGAAKLGQQPRFREVRRLEAAIEVLAERFRVFAAAQERALDARERAQRMRGLLFASVSHDLKSPLNAILGFAAILETEELLPPQRESLELITTRGRELLALIETILDAARVEARQLRMEFQSTETTALLTEATRKARELVGEDPDSSPTTRRAVIEVASHIPSACLDAGYITRAIAVIVAHALRSSAADPSAGIVRLRGTVPSPGRALRIDIEYNHRAVTPGKLTALFSRQDSARGRGLTLGLSLARSIFELHGGNVDVEGATDEAPVVRCTVPLRPERFDTFRPTLSSHPALG